MRGDHRAEQTVGYHLCCSRYQSRLTRWVMQPVRMTPNTKCLGNSRVVGSPHINDSIPTPSSSSLMSLGSIISYRWGIAIWALFLLMSLYVCQIGFCLRGCCRLSKLQMHRCYCLYKEGATVGWACVSLLEEGLLRMVAFSFCTVVLLVAASVTLHQAARTTAMAQRCMVVIGGGVLWQRVSVGPKRLYNKGREKEKHHARPHL